MPLRIGEAFAFALVGEVQVGRGQDVVGHGLLVGQGAGGFGAGGHQRRDDGKEQGHDEGDDADAADDGRVDFRRQFVDEVHLRGQGVAGVAFQKLP